MKYTGCVLDFTNERNADLMRAYRQHLRAAKYIVMPDIFERVANSPASRFWVSEHRAMVVVSAMLAGRPLPKMRRCKLEMFQEIYGRTIRLLRQDPSRSIFSAVAEVVNQPAPKFYFTPRTVGEFIYRIKNGWYDRRFDRNKRDFSGERPATQTD